MQAAAKLIPCWLADMFEPEVHKIAARAMIERASKLANRNQRDEWTVLLGAHEAFVLLREQVALESVDIWRMLLLKMMFDTCERSGDMDVLLEVLQYIAKTPQ